MPSAIEFIVAGIRHETYLEWAEIGGFDIHKMSSLTGRFNLKDLGRKVRISCGGYEATIAYGS